MPNSDIETEALPSLRGLSQVIHKKMSINQSVNFSFGHRPANSQEKIFAEKETSPP